MVMIESGAAALTIPPGATTGGSWLAPSPPDTCFTPLTAPCELRAFTVIVTPAPCPLLVCQVASQRPLASGLKLKAGSPLENSAVTEPASSAVPQLSRTSTCSASGQPAGTVEPPPSEAMVGNNAARAQPASASRFAILADTAPGTGAVTPPKAMPSLLSRPSEEFN